MTDEQQIAALQEETRRAGARTWLGRLVLAYTPLGFGLAFAAWNASSRAQSFAGALEPLIKIPDSQLSSPPVVIAYGDMRFTDASNAEDTNPKVRRWLASQASLAASASGVRCAFKAARLWRRFFIDPRSVS